MSSSEPIEVPSAVLATILRLAMIFAASCEVPWIVGLPSSNLRILRRSKTRASSAAIGLTSSKIPKRPHSWMRSQWRTKMPVPSRVKKPSRQVKKLTMAGVRMSAVRSARSYWIVMRARYCSRKIGSS